jgi:hypothetical protein
MVACEGQEIPSDQKLVSCFVAPCTAKPVPAFAESALEDVLQKLMRLLRNMLKIMPLRDFLSIDPFRSKGQAR